MIMIKGIVVIVGLLLWPSKAVLNAQVCRDPGHPAGALGKPLQIPIQIHGGAVFIDVQLNGKDSFSFQLDSGFEESVIDSGTAKRLRMTTIRKHTTLAPGGKIELSRVEGLRRVVAGIPLRPESLAVTDFSGLAPFFGHRVDGILGFDFFQQFVVILDYEHQRLGLCEPASFRYSGDGTSVPIDLSTRQPYIRARIAIGTQEPVEAAIEIDTGKVDPFSLNLKFAERHGLMKDKNALLALRGTSLGGHTEAWVGRARALSWNNISLDAPIVGFAEERVARPGGQIGFGVLRRFRIIFDYSRRQVVFEPNSRFREDYNFDRVGLILVSEGTPVATLKAYMVIAGSPAAVANIRDGDEIIAIDARASKEFSLQEARDYFEQATGRHILTVRRDGKSFDVPIVCRALL
jgi:hypothetical protein